MSPAVPVGVALSRTGGTVGEGAVVWVGMIVRKRFRKEILVNDHINKPTAKVGKLMFLRHI
jgi:hypothetical protein